jgi:hypothetical protein
VADRVLAGQVGQVLGVVQERHRVQRGADHHDLAAGLDELCLR